MVNVGKSSALWMRLVCMHQDKKSKHKLVEAAFCTSDPRCKNIFYMDVQRTFLAACHLSQSCFIGSNDIIFLLSYARKHMGNRLPRLVWILLLIHMGFNSLPFRLIINITLDKPEQELS